MVHEGSPPAVSGWNEKITPKSIDGVKKGIRVGVVVTKQDFNIASAADGRVG